MDENSNNALKAHDLYWTSYLNGQTDVLASLLDENYLQIGSVEEEVFFNKKDAVGFVKNTIDQITGKVEMRNRVTKSKKLSGYILINEFCDLYVKTDKEWNFYAKFRATSLMQQKTDGWKLIHQHSSLPDSKTEEGENIAIEKINQENLALKNAIKRRTAELENKNRELEIETSLERVRGGAMALRVSDDLKEVVAIIFNELEEFDLDIYDSNIIILNQEKKEYTMWGSGLGGIDLPPSFTIPHFDHSYFNQMFEDIIHYDQIKEEEKFRSVHLSGETLKKLHEFYITETEFKHAPDDYLDEMLSVNEITLSYAVMEHGTLEVASDGPLPDDTEEILKRFARVIELTYTRFLDLKQAEAQAHEARIEASLERVRARAMAMHSSDELNDVVHKLFTEFQQLGIAALATDIIIFNEDGNTANIWISGSDGTEGPYLTRALDHPHQSETIEAWKNNLPLRVTELKGEYFKSFFELAFNETDGIKTVSEETKKAIFDLGRLFHTEAFTRHGCIRIASLEKLTDISEYTLQRFAKVFEQTYTRFLDLQKAEEQAREAQIEASLERVRAKAMAMHSSKDIESATAVVFNELTRLGIDMERCGIVLINETPIFEIWSTPLSPKNKEVINVITGHIDSRMHPMAMHFHQEWREKKDYSFYRLIGDEVQEYYDKLEKQPDYQFPKIARYPDQQIAYNFFFNEGCIFAFTTDELSGEEKNIFKRFAKVFEQTYTRFLDIQKAEAQARKAEIEASLERVRAKAMTMHSSKDIESATAVVFNELSRLGIDMERCGITLMNKAPTAEIWSTPLSQDNKEVVEVITGYVNLGIHPILQQCYQDWREKKDLCTYKLIGDEVKKYYAKLEEQPEYKFPKVANYPDQQILNTFYFKEGVIFAYTIDELSEEAKDIIQKFTKVFAQTYTRFLDLQKAEAQAREAKIEAALERIRSRSMAMQSSDELSEVVRVMYDEVEKLEVSNWGCALMIFDNKNKNIQLWFSESVNRQHARPYDFDNLNHELVRKWWKFWESEDEFMSIHLKDEESDEWTTYMFEDTGMKNLPKEVKEAIMSENEVYFKYVKTKHGLVSFIDLEPFPEEIFPILKRIARTFEQAYTRFLDVQIAEESARKARQQASLDRVRADISSMRTAEDLNSITPLIWNELTTLGIPFIRCGVFIVHEEEEEVEVYLSKPDGTSLAVMHLPFGSSDLAVQTVDAWQQRRVYTQHWTQEEFLDWGRSMVEQGQVRDLESYRGAEAPPESLNLHLIPFRQGMLYVGSTNPLDDEEIDLAASLAETFSIAYARYEDFVKLEKAKAGIEDALSELKATQSQLVQQEKLASLGQLTAGIAHEIKNPLNFVNNFSDLSIELVEEAREEVKEKLTADSHQLIATLDDIEANLRKIHEHGTRADGIVKSMLQHSRGGSGKIEPTDVNALIKEYANLAFHGMRAGKDPINVDIELDLDKDVGEVDLIAEDFSRVILNICNNAFDAMREKTLPGFETLGGLEPYQPKLTIRTHQIDQTVTIEIEDNGPGIPDEIKEKILQPFFTTKKGTQGTGLGLSITNDIMKAHGGKIDIQSNKNGTMVIISVKNS